MSLATNPPQVAHGIASTKEGARNAVGFTFLHLFELNWHLAWIQCLILMSLWAFLQAALQMLEELSKIGLDNVKSTENNETEPVPQSLGTESTPEVST